MERDSIRASLDSFYTRGYAISANSRAYRSWADSLISQIFLAPRLPYVELIESPHRSSQVLSIADGGLIAIDKRQAALLSSMDYLLSQPSRINEANITLVALMLSGALRGHISLSEQCWILTERWFADRNRLYELAQAMMATPGYSATAMPLLFHEVAHLQIAERHTEFQWVADFVNSSFDAYERTVSSPLDGFYQFGETNDVQTLKAYLALHKNLLRQDRNEIISEACCDVIACINLIRIRTGKRLFDEGCYDGDWSDYAKVVDFIVLSTRISRLLMIQGAAAQLADALASADEHGELASAFSQMTARAAIVRHVVLGLAQTMNDLLQPKPDSVSDAIFQIKQRLGHVATLSHRLFLEPLQDFGRLLNGPERLAELAHGVTPLSMAPGVPPFAAWYERADQLTNEFPI